MSKPSNVNNSINLDICLGESYAGLKTSNSEKYNYSNYELDEKLSSRSLGDFLHKILFDKKIYNYDINNVTIHFDNYLYCLVPNELFDESKKKEYLSISLKKFNNLNQEMKMRVVNKSIKELTKSYYTPRSKKTINLVRELEAKKKAKLTLGGCLILMKKNQIIIKKEIKIRNAR